MSPPRYAPRAVPPGAVRRSRIFVPEATYTVRFSAAGLRTITRSLEVVEGSVEPLSVSMEPEAASEAGEPQGTAGAPVSKDRTFAALNIQRSGCQPVRPSSTGLGHTRSQGR